MPRHAEAATAVLTLPVSEERDHVLGDPRATVTLVEYGDFECPHCGQAHLVLNTLMKLYGDQVRLVYRHFPLTQVHPHAERAAEAAEAAGAQGKFWEMHDKIFADQAHMDRPTYEKYAGELGLNMSKFKAALDAEKGKALAADLIALIGEFNRATDGTMAVHSEYLEVVVTR